MGPPRYAPAARALHWITAAIIAVVIVVGVWIHYFEPADEPFKLRLYNVHESLGVVVFALTLARLAYRLGHPAPPLPHDTPGPIRVAAHLTHAALYVLLLVMPVLGFLATNAWGFPLKVFGALPLPSPLGKDEALAKVLSALHWSGALAFVVLIAGHLGGVVHHTFIRRDGLLRRMI